MSVGDETDERGDGGQMGREEAWCGGREVREVKEAREA